MKDKFTKSFAISLGLHLVFLIGLALFIQNNPDKFDTFINVDIFHFSQPKVRPRKNIVKTLRPVLTHEEADLLDHHNFRNWDAFQARNLMQTSATTVITKSGDDSHELIVGYEIHDIFGIPSKRIIRETPVKPYKIELNRSNSLQITQGFNSHFNDVPHRLPGLHSILTSITLTGNRINPMNEFLELIRHKIEDAKMYPHWAQEAGYEGVTKIQFAILSDGQLGVVSIVDSSGYDILDNAAIEAIKKAAPFPALPDLLNRDILRIELPIAFRLSMES